MDFRPNTNTLVANYVATFSVVGLLLYFSVGNPTRFYYSPAYSSHAGYATGMESCNQCHVKAWSSFDESTCWTSGCHGDFDPKAGSAEEARTATAKDANGNEKRHYGAMVAFHKKLPPDVSCESCHPSHSLPQTGQFNAATIALEVEQRQKSGAAADPHALRSEIFHTRAERFTGKLSCTACHVDTDGGTGAGAGMGAASGAGASPQSWQLPSAAPALTNLNQVIGER